MVTTVKASYLFNQSDIILIDSHAQQPTLDNQVRRLFKHGATETNTSRLTAHQTATRKSHTRVLY